MAFRSDRHLATLISATARSLEAFWLTSSRCAAHIMARATIRTRSLRSRIYGRNRNSRNFRSLGTCKVAGSIYGGWCSLLRTSLCGSNSLIYRENTGKYINFGHNLGTVRPETAVAAEAFFRNSLEFVSGNYFCGAGKFPRTSGN